MLVGNCGGCNDGQTKKCHWHRRGQLLARLLCNQSSHLTSQCVSAQTTLAGHTVLGCMRHTRVGIKHPLAAPSALATHHRYVCHASHQVGTQARTVASTLMRPVRCLRRPSMRYLKRPCDRDSLWSRGMCVSSDHWHCRCKKLTGRPATRSNVHVQHFRTKISGTALILSIKIHSHSPSPDVLPLSDCAHFGPSRFRSLRFRHNTRQDKTMVRNGCRHKCLYIRILVTY